MSGRIDIEPDNVLEFGGELRIVRQLELPDPVRLEAMASPDALDRADADAGSLRHHRPGPVGGLARRVGHGQCNHPLDHRAIQRLDPGGARLVPQQAIEALRGKAFLPAPDTGLRLAGSAHDLVGADAVCAVQDNLGAPDMLLRCVAIGQQALQAATVGCGDRNRNPGAHAPDSHAWTKTGIPIGIQMSDLIH